jgi:hypothetical protein
MNFPARQTCTTATISLVFGILSWCGLTVIGAVVAIVCGHMARGEIRRSNGALDGDGLATVGLVLGYLHLLAVFLFVFCLFVFFGGVATLIAFGNHIHHFSH